MSNARVERLLNLVFVLSNASRPLTKARLRELVYDDSSSQEAFERMFERDKEELRALGVPVETVAIDVLAEDESGYRLVKDWRLPELSFTTAELSVLAVAASTWQDACLAPAAGTALRKLETGGEAWAAPGLPVTPRVATNSPAFETILGAINARRELRFDYRKPDGSASLRRLHPHHLVQRTGYWYVVGDDLDRVAPRSFRLSRIVGQVRAVGPAGAFEAPTVDGDDPPWHATLQEPAEVATVRVRKGAANQLRRRAELVSSDAEHDVLKVEYRDPDSFSAALAAMGGAVVVESPESLRTAVVARLRAVAGDAS